LIDGKDLFAKVSFLTIALTVSEVLSVWLATLSIKFPVFSHISGAEPEVEIMTDWSKLAWAHNMPLGKSVHVKDIPSSEIPQYVICW
jgi:hypothetical protein